MLQVVGLSVEPQLNPYLISLHETKVAEDIAPNFLNKLDYYHAYREIFTQKPGLSVLQDADGEAEGGSGYELSLTFQNADRASERVSGWLESRTWGETR